LSFYINIISHIVPKYLNSATNCKSFLSSLSEGKVFEMILLLFLGGNTIHHADCFTQVHCQQ